MNYDALMFQGESPIIDGTWYNPNTGDSFTVADAFFQDNQYLIKCRDGRMLDYNFIKDYIKSDKPIPKQTQQPPKQVHPKEVMDLIEPQNNINEGILADDLALIQGTSLGNLNGVNNLNGINNLNEVNNINTPTPQAPINVNESIITKALAKTNQPLLDIKVNWDDFPTKELDLLIDVMDIDINDIIDWYTTKIDMNEVKNIISNSLIKYIKKQFESKVVQEEAPKPTPKKTKTKK